MIEEIGRQRQCGACSLLFVASDPQKCPSCGVLGDPRDFPTLYAKEIANQNDDFRKSLAGFVTDLSGSIVCTQAVSALDTATRIQLISQVAFFSDFSDDNDPNAEREFGSIDLNSEKYFWKIDYYSDVSVKFGSEEPWNPKATYRVLTILHSHEY